MVSALYLTQDGITDHIGQAQIAPYLLGLAEGGHSIHIVSAEKPGRTELERKYQKAFAHRGIEWTKVRYSNKPPLVSSFMTLARMYRAARRAARTGTFDLVHCRAYLPLEIALRLKQEFGLKLLVDFRDFWADVGLEKKPFKFVFRYLKRREPAYFAAADHIVTLTDAAREILVDWYPTGISGDRTHYTTIPCCADFDHFDLGRFSGADIARTREALRLGAGPVLLYLGSIGHDYLLTQMLILFKELVALNPSARFLFVSNNAREQVYREAAHQNIPSDLLRFVTVDRARVPEFIALADFSVVFIRPTKSKAGCSPTKLAELFACNVPVIANSGVGDIDEILVYERNGSLVVPDFAPATLRSAIQCLLDEPEALRRGIRSASQEFSLEEGIRRYDSVYRCLAGPCST
jgi:glycosyltransferase involved in cell wall biosynthesis